MPSEEYEIFAVKCGAATDIFIIRQNPRYSCVFLDATVLHLVALQI